MVIRHLDLRYQNLRKLCSDQEKLIELLQAQLKNKEQMIAASDQVIEQIIRSHQREE